MAFFEVKLRSEVLGMGASVDVVIPQKPSRGNIGISSAETGDTFPTLFLLHGMSDDQTIWHRRTSIERYADEHGIAVVMPTTNLGWYTDMHFGYRWRTYIGEELPRLLRSFFPGMSDKREDTYLSGNSMGGYGSLALAFTYPETFSIAAPLSGAFDPEHMYDPNHPENTYIFDMFGPIDEYYGSKNDLFALAEKVKESGAPMPEIYIGCGTEDGLITVNRKMRDHLTSLGYDVTYSEAPGGHEWGYWDREIQKVLNYIDSRRKEVR